MYKELKEIRIRKGYSLSDMARVIGKSSCNYLKKENGTVVFSVTEAIAIAKFLKVKVEKIFFENNVSENEKKEKI